MEIPSQTSRALSSRFPGTPFGSVTIAVLHVLAADGRAGELRASNGAIEDRLGNAVSISGGNVLGGASNMDQGATRDVGTAYLFRNAANATTSLTESVKLFASDAAADDQFGNAVVLSGSMALIGAWYDDDLGDASGAAYLFRGLDTASGTITQSAKLRPSDGSPYAAFGSALAISGNSAIVGATYKVVNETPNVGGAYLYRNLDTISGTVTEDVRLVPSTSPGTFGYSVSYEGDSALVSALQDTVGSVKSGAVYLFRGLAAATGNLSEAARLVPSDPAANDNFGRSVSQSGSIAVVGSRQDDDLGSNSGSAYVYRNIDTVTGTVTQQAKLLASDGAASDNLGTAVSISGTLALVSAPTNDDLASNTGSVYLFQHLDTVTGSVNEAVKINASVATANDNFGTSVDLKGDFFAIGSIGADTTAVDAGKIFTGSVSSLTTLDAGNTSKIIDGISFSSRVNWVVGETTDSNAVTLTAGDQATLSLAGTAVYIGKQAGSDGNLLTLGGKLVTTAVHIGSELGNSGNIFRLEVGSMLTSDSILLAPGNFLEIAGNYTNIQDLLTYLGSNDLQVRDAGQWTTVTFANYEGLISIASENSYTKVAVVPEPGAAVSLVGGVAFLLGFHRRRRGAVIADRSEG